VLARRLAVAILVNSVLVCIVEFLNCALSCSLEGFLSYCGSYLYTLVSYSISTSVQNYDRLNCSQVSDIINVLTPADFED